MMKQEKKMKREKEGRGRLLKRTVNKGIMFIERNAVTIASVLFLIFLIFSENPIYANSAETMWTTVTELIGTWILRLGGVVVFVGGVMFGLGWKSDDAEQKSRGISTIVAGCIVMAVAGLASTFFA